LQLQEIETAVGRVKRYARPEETAPPAAPLLCYPRRRRWCLPNWLLTPAQPEMSAESFVRPSDPADDDSRKVRTAESLTQRARALQRGTLVHRLLQSLPDIEPAPPRGRAGLSGPQCRWLERGGNGRRWPKARWP